MYLLSDDWHSFNTTIAQRAGPVRSLQTRRWACLYFGGVRSREVHLVPLFHCNSNSVCFENTVTFRTHSDKTFCVVSGSAKFRSATLLSVFGKNFRCAWLHRSCSFDTPLCFCFCCVWMCSFGNTMNVCSDTMWNRDFTHSKFTLNLAWQVDLFLGALRQTPEPHGWRHSLNHIPFLRELCRITEHPVDKCWDKMIASFMFLWDSAGGAFVHLHGHLTLVHFMFWDKYFVKMFAVAVKTDGAVSFHKLEKMHFGCFAWDCFIVPQIWVFLLSCLLRVRLQKRNFEQDTHTHTHTTRLHDFSGKVQDQT